MHFLLKERKIDLAVLAEKLGEKASAEDGWFKLKRIISESKEYEEDKVKRLLESIREERKEREREEKEKKREEKEREREEKEKKREEKEREWEEKMKKIRLEHELKLEEMRKKYRPFETERNGKGDDGKESEVNGKVTGRGVKDMLGPGKDDLGGAEFPADKGGFSGVLNSGTGNSGKGESVLPEEYLGAGAKRVLEPALGSQVEAKLNSVPFRVEVEEGICSDLNTQMAVKGEALLITPQECCRLKKQERKEVRGKEKKERNNKEGLHESAMIAPQAYRGLRKREERRLECESGGRDHISEGMKVGSDSETKEERGQFGRVTGDLSLGAVEGKGLGGNDPSISQSVEGGKSETDPPGQESREEKLVNVKGSVSRVEPNEEIQTSGGNEKAKVDAREGDKEFAREGTDLIPGAIEEMDFSVENDPPFSQQLKEGNSDPLDVEGDFPSKVPVDRRAEGGENKRGGTHPYLSQVPEKQQGGELLMLVVQEVETGGKQCVEKFRAINHADIDMVRRSEQLDESQSDKQNNDREVECNMAELFYGEDILISKDVRGSEGNLRRIRVPDKLAISKQRHFQTNWAEKFSGNCGVGVKKIKVKLKTEGLIKIHELLRRGLLEPD